MAKRAPRPEPTQDPLPAVLISPSKAEPHQRDAYWLQLLEDPEQFKAAVQTEEPWPMLKSFPEALWGDRLSLFIYRLPDDETGVMLKNAEGQAKYIKPVVRFAIDEDWVATKHGGGKYQWWLKLDDTIIRKHTFRIDGAPKVAQGQTLEVEGKVVSLPGAAPAASAEPRSDIAAAIDANSRATEAGMKILTNASATALEMVKEQAAAASSSAPIPQSPLATLEGIAAIAKMFQPPTDPTVTALTLIDKLDAIAARRNPAPAEREEKETPLDETLGVIQKLTGFESIADLLKSKARNPEPDGYGWVTPLANIGQQLVAQIPAIMHEARINRDLEFRRAVWLRSSQPGAAVPQDLMLPANGTAPAQSATPPANQRPPQQPPTNAAPDAAQLVPILVQMICHGFDMNPRMGFQTAAAIDFSYGQQIEALGLDKFLSNPTQVTEFVAGTPVLAQRSTDARWQKFQAEFLDYTTERFGDEEDEDEKPGPQPVA